MKLSKEDRMFILSLQTALFLFGPITAAFFVAGGWLNWLAKAPTSIGVWRQSLIAASAIGIVLLAIWVTLKRIAPAWTKKVVQRMEEIRKEVPDE